MTVQELAAKTAAEIRRRGWTFGVMADYSGGAGPDTCKVCAVGGIAAAAYGHPMAMDWREKNTGEWLEPQDPDVKGLLEEILLRTDRQILPWSSSIRAVTSWNDRQITRWPKDEAARMVLSVFDEIASGS